jgi:hypothetical protein
VHTATEQGPWASLTNSMVRYLSYGSRKWPNMQKDSPLPGSLPMTGRNSTCPELSLIIPFAFSCILFQTQEDCL